MATVHQPCVREVVLHFARAILGARVQQLLDTLPGFAVYQLLMRARVRVAVPIEVAAVQAFPQDLVDDAALQPAAAQLKALCVHLLYERPHRMLALCKSFKNLTYYWRRIGIGDDRAFSVGTVYVPIPYRRVTGPNASASLFGHSLYGFLAQVEAVVSCHQDLDSVDKLLRRARIAADDLVFFDEMDLDTKFVYRRVILYVSVEAIRLLDEDCAAYTGMLFQIAKHLTEFCPAALFSRLHVGELTGDHKPLVVGVLA